MGITIPKEKLETTVVFGDVHGVYYDPKAWSILLQIIDDLKPNRVVINGDFMDCYSISSFDKDPNRDYNIQDEFDQANKLLDELQHIHKGETIFVCGNHCDRLRKKLWKDAPELSSLSGMTIQSRLFLDERKIQWIEPKGKSAYYKLGKIKIGHFNIARQDSCASEKALVLRYAGTVLQGHTHKLGKFYKSFDGDVVVGVGTGCLCDLNPEYCSDPDWCQGLVVISKLKGVNRFHIQDVPIIKHETLFNGKLYKV